MFIFNYSSNNSDVASSMYSDTQRGACQLVTYWYVVVSVLIVRVLDEELSARVQVDVPEGEVGLGAVDGAPETEALGAALRVVWVEAECARGTHVAMLTNYICL